MGAIKLYWSSSRPNVGDWLSPRIVAAQTSRPIEHALAKKCELMAIGSILHKAKNYWWSPVVDVWGSGFMHDRAPSRSKHRLHAVRGKLTRERIVNAADAALGDPGLLVSSVFANVASANKKHAIGVIPHYTDNENTQLKAFLKRYPQAKFLDILNDVDSFIAEMTECEFILSSSLHGLIMADSFGIPNQWLVISDKVEGNNFKFHDYYSVFDIAQPAFSDLDSLTLEKIEKIAAAYSRPGLQDAQKALIASFPDHLK